MIKKKLRQKCSAFFVYIVSITDAVANCSKHCAEVTDRAWKASLKAIRFSSLKEYFWRKLCFLYLPLRHSHKVAISTFTAHLSSSYICLFPTSKASSSLSSYAEMNDEIKHLRVLISISLVYNFSLTYWTNSFHHDLRKKGRPIFSAESMEIVGGFLSR